MTLFRPCIDLHQGQVKQLVGGTLTDSGQGLRTNFVSGHAARWYAELYRRDGLQGGHVIMLGPGNQEQAMDALQAFPGGLQIGGGLDETNALAYLAAGASHVILTSWLFPDGILSRERLLRMSALVGRDRLVVDLSCRRRGAEWRVAMNRWQTVTETRLDEALLHTLAGHCAEFLIHAADVEGRCEGLDWELVDFLSRISPLPTTYAGGSRDVADLARVEEASGGRLDLSIGSALDIFRRPGQVCRMRGIQRARRVSREAVKPVIGEDPAESLESGGPDRASGRQVIARSARKDEILEYSLVLASQGIKHWIEFDGAEFALSLDVDSLPLAKSLLETYRAENESFRDERPQARNLDLFLAPLFHLAIPVTAYFWVGIQPWADWLKEQGLADSRLILAGEWWRCLTATLLHADHEHFLGNVLTGYFLLNLLNHRLGMGTIMLASTLGAGLSNFLVALASGDAHRSLGFSTVVFCVLGMLAAVETSLLPKRRDRNLRRLTPLLGAFFIAVLVGLGEKADVKAHFYGFGVGALTGFLCRTLPAALARPPWQFGLIFLTYGLYALAWVLAAG